MDGGRERWRRSIRANIPHLHTQVHFHAGTVFKVDLLRPVEDLVADGSLDAVARHDDLGGGEGGEHCGAPLDSIMHSSDVHSHFHRLYA